jgi:hypothetical protein
MWAMPPMAAIGAARAGVKRGESIMRLPPASAGRRTNQADAPNESSEQ